MKQLRNILVMFLVATASVVGIGAEPASASDSWCSATSNTPYMWDVKLKFIGGGTTTTCKGEVYVINVESELHRWSESAGQWVPSGSGERSCEDTTTCYADAWFNCQGMGNPGPAFATRGNSVSVFGYSSTAKNSSVSGWRQFDCGGSGIPLIRP